jgi:8-hydroxy-5-deazaflavin:NADPH oxidoreductase
LGTAWRNRGHEVTFGVRHPDDPKYASLGAIETNESATAAADVVALCTPWQGTEAVQGCGDLGGNVLIDCTNPLAPDFASLEVGLVTSGAEEVAKRALLEPYALLWIHLALRRGFDTNFGFGLLRGQS